MPNRTLHPDAREAAFRMSYRSRVPVSVDVGKHLRRLAVM